jgi:hypothetical protein
MRNSEQRMLSFSYLIIEDFLKGVFILSSYQISRVAVNSEKTVKDFFDAKSLGRDQKTVLVKEVQEHGVGERQHDAE